MVSIIKKIVIFLIAGALLPPFVWAKDLSRYRDFDIGMTLEDAFGFCTADELKVIDRDGWTREYGGYAGVKVQLVFFQKNGSLSSIWVRYDAAEDHVTILEELIPVYGKPDEDTGWYNDFFTRRPHRLYRWLSPLLEVTFECDLANSRKYYCIFKIRKKG